MIKAVLLDLDDTLLINNDAAFVPAYLREIDAFFAKAISYQGISKSIIAAMKAMVASIEYDQTNLDVASRTIADRLGRNEAELAPHYDTFYAKHFPSLESFTKRIEVAAQLIDRLTEMGISVIIATNPLYPATAIYQRLGWAGLSPSPESYAWVTTANNMHFTKPSPAYYAEVLARIGIEPNESIMVGNSLENDIIPANQIGIHTFHITTEARSTPIATAIGSLNDFYNCVQQGWLENIQAMPITPGMIEPQLIGNLAALFGLLSEVQPHQWTQHPLNDEWSILEIVCHLYNRESNVQRKRLQQILEEDNPFLRTPSRDSPNEKNCEADGLKIAYQFAAEREQTLTFLRSLTAEDWQRPARHSIFSNTTLLEMTHFLAQHDRMHITQICQTLGRCN